MNSFEQKAFRFVAALADVYKDEENRELGGFSKLELSNDFTEDLTAILVAIKVFVDELFGDDGKDLIDFTHILNKLAIQHIMKKQEDNDG